MHDIWNPWHGCVKCKVNKASVATLALFDWPRAVKDVYAKIFAQKNSSPP